MRRPTAGTDWLDNATTSSDVANVTVVAIARHGRRFAQAKAPDDVTLHCACESGQAGIAPALGDSKTGAARLIGGRRPMGMRDRSRELSRAAARAVAAAPSSTPHLESTPRPSALQGRSPPQKDTLFYRRNYLGFRPRSAMKRAPAQRVGAAGSPCRLYRLGEAGAACACNPDVQASPGRYRKTSWRRGVWRGSLPLRRALSSRRSPLACRA